MHALCRVGSCAVAVLVACGAPDVPATDRAPGSAGAAGVPGASISSAASVRGGWDDILGPVVATPSAESGAPTLFVRDTASTADIEVELFNHEARTTRAMLRPTARLRGCAWQRSAALSTGAALAVPVVWSLALAPGVATPLSIDPISELLPRDSAALVARISKLVSALPDDSTSPAFHGLPIVVRDAWRLATPGDSVPTVVAIATRSLNAESNPRSELVTVIAEPESSADAAILRTVFAHRVTGPEDRVEGTDLLAALRLKNSRIAVVFAHEGERATQLELVERNERGRWSARWSSAALPCAK